MKHDELTHLLRSADRSLPASPNQPLPDLVAAVHSRVRERARKRLALTAAALVTLAGVWTVLAQYTSSSSHPALELVARRPGADPGVRPRASAVSITEVLDHSARVTSRLSRVTGDQRRRTRLYALGSDDAIDDDAEWLAWSWERRASQLWSEGKQDDARASNDRLQRIFPDTSAAEAARARRFRNETERESLDNPR